MIQNKNDQDNSIGDKDFPKELFNKSKKFIF